MSIQHREDSIRDMKLERLGVTPPQDWNDVEQVRTAKKAEIGLACSAAIYTLQPDRTRPNRTYGAVPDGQGGCGGSAVPRRR